VGELRDVDAEGNSVILQPLVQVEIQEIVAAVEGVDLNRFDLKKFYTQEQIKQAERLAGVR